MRSWLLDSVLIFALSAFLIWPLFRLDYMENWGSIESTFIGDARMLRERVVEMSRNGDRWHQCSIGSPIRRRPVSGIIRSFIVVSWHHGDRRV